MHTAVKIWVMLAVLGVGTLDAAAIGDQAKIEFFEMKVRPLLANNCYACHTNSKMGGLRLDSRQSMVRGGSSGPAVRPGNATGSILIQAVTHTHDRLKMPPTGEKLDDKQVEALKTWIQEGAAWPDEDLPPTMAETTKYAIRPEQRNFWSFRPVSKPALPPVKVVAWVREPPDHFILAKLEAESLEAAPAADKRTLIRRATFDLIGLPPTPEEIDAFLADDSPKAFEAVVERLLASRHYGERWGRYWLDLARYSDGKLGTREDDPYPNAYRYRDWVIQAFNDDLPYDQFVRAQLAADLLPDAEREKHLPALGFHAFVPRGDDRVDVTTRTFLGLTVGCAQCHDHKYDPIPTKDFYSLQGVFASSASHEYPLAPDDRVKAYKQAQKAIADKKAAISRFIEEQSGQLIDVLLGQAAEYMTAAWQVMSGAQPDEASAAVEAGLIPEIVERWVVYLKSDKEHEYLDEFDAAVADGAMLEQVAHLAEQAESQALAINTEKKEIEDRNYVKLGGAEGVADERTRQYTNLEFLDLKKWYFWRDLAFEPNTRNGFRFDGGVFYFGENPAERDGKPEEDRKIDHFLSGLWKQHLDRLRSDLKDFEEALPEAYPFIHGYKEAEKIKDLQVYIRGDKDNLGELAPRRFLHILSPDEPEPFKDGSGRLEMAERIASAENPLTARVMVNRIWQHHFGQGLVRTPSNFGQLGERPTHPDLLDYLAARFVKGGWSVKAVHREIMLSATYRLSTAQTARNVERDPDNKLLWRANLIQRLDAEALRDSILAVSGKLDPKAGGPPENFSDDNHRRTVYARVQRTQPNRTMALFDFPDPNNTSEKRLVTVGPMQRLYFLNSSFVMSQAEALAKRLAGEAGHDDRDRIQRAYELLYGRPPSKREIKTGIEYLKKASDAWSKYAQVLLASTEFSSVN